MEPWSEVLRAVLDAPGARYACLADPASGTVVAARGEATPGPDTDPAEADPAGADAGDLPGNLPGDVAAVLGWGRAEAGRATTGESEAGRSEASGGSAGGALAGGSPADGSPADGPSFEDAVITTGTAYHLVRALPRDDGMLVAYLQVDRAHGNLALARRALLALSPAGAATPAPRPPTTPTAAPGTTPPVAPAPRSGTTGPGPHPAPPVPEQARAPDAERTPPLPVPLPRRGTDPSGGGPPAGAPASALAPAAGSGTPAPGEQAGAAPSTPPGRPGGLWADDLATMARILAGLRRLDQ